MWGRDKKRKQECNVFQSGLLTMYVMAHLIAASHRPECDGSVLDARFLDSQYNVKTRNSGCQSGIDILIAGHRLIVNSC